MANMSTHEHLRLEGKVAVITGAASGIGAATARLFVANGAKVVIADIKDDLGEKVAAELGDTHARFVHCDVTKESDVAALVKFAVSTFGKLDIYYSNAGYFGNGTLLQELNMEAVDQVMGVNLRGMLLGIKYASQAMIPAKQGVILCTASATGVIAVGSPIYGISKAAVIAATKYAAAELGEHGIRVNCISPYLVVTEFGLQGMLNSGFQNLKLTNLHELEQMAVDIHHTEVAGARLTPESIAHAALFLASNNESSFISGHNLVVDGGYSTNKKSVGATH